MAEKTPRFRALTNRGDPRGRSDRRLTPDLQVLVGIGGLLGLVAAAVLVAVLLIVGLRNDATALASRQVAYANAVDTAALNAKGIANDERGFLMSGRAEFLHQIEDRAAAARAAFALAARHASDTARRKAVGEAQAGFERWMDALNAGLATFRAGDPEAAVASSLGPTRTLRKIYEAALARADALGHQGIESATDSVSATSSRSVAILIGYLIAALVVGLGLTLWIVRTVLRPVHALLRLLGDQEEARVTT
ncbi:MAG: CHASE3 domain-containing protein [Gaiellaceae bacterium]